ncbi:MAG: hypothetical protein BRD50_09115 [Bacteroidetes bacterium SW_11_45_7]|nr:MAG: hypothetical protein BRD50_09115 [Bacteroidetes bacterium SW_11_45_7]
MKRLIVFFLFLTSTIIAFGQRAGIEVSPGLTVPGANVSPGLGFSSGFYYDQPIYKKLGVSTGVLYTRLSATDRSPTCLASPDIPCPEKIQDQFGVIEIPVDVTIDVTMPPNADWEVYLKAGYSFGYIVRQQKVRHFPERKTSREITSLKGLRSHSHFFRIGFEVQRSISEQINISMGGQYKFAGIYQQFYGGFSNYNIFVKLGYNFPKGTED